MSVRIITAISVLALLAGCSTTQENPHYQQSTKYKVHAPAGATTTPAPITYANYSDGTATAQTHRSYNTTTSVPTTTHVYQASSETYAQPATTVNHKCLNKEGTRKLLGTGVGGAAGGFAGHELIGGTKGTIIGAVVGGAAGYGIADKTIRCDPIPVAAQVAPTTYVEPGSYSTSTTVQDYDAGYQAGYQAASTQAQSTVSPAPTTVEPNHAAPTDSAYGETFGTPGYHAMQANGDMGDTTTASSTVSIPAPQPVTAPSYGYPQNTAQPTYPQTATAQTTGQGVTMHKVVEGNTVYSLSRQLCVGVEDVRNLNSLDGNFSIKLDDFIKLPASRC